MTTKGWSPRGSFVDLTVTRANSSYETSCRVRCNGSEINIVSLFLLEMKMLEVAIRLSACVFTLDRQDPSASAAVEGYVPGREHDLDTPSSSASDEAIEVLLSC